MTQSLLFFRWYNYVKWHQAVRIRLIPQLYCRILVQVIAKPTAVVGTETE